MSNYDDINAECYQANLLLPEYKLIDLTFTFTTAWDQTSKSRYHSGFQNQSV